MRKEFVENTKICSSCGGKCCKSNPGVYKGGEVMPYIWSIGVEYGIVVDIIINPKEIHMVIPDVNKAPKDLLRIAKNEWRLMYEGGYASDSDFVVYLLALRPIGVMDKVGIVNTKYLTDDNSVKGNACRYLTPSGCKLSLDDRPYECKVLIPQPNHICGEHGNRYGYLGDDIASSWIPYQDSIRELFKDYVMSLNREQVSSLIEMCDDLFMSMLDEGFLGMYLRSDGTVGFNNK